MASKRSGGEGDGETERQTKKQKVSSIAAVSDLLSTPEGERAEWINKIIGQVWPFVRKFANDTVNREIYIHSLCPLLVWLLDWLGFFTHDLGGMPPRVEDVKVYTQKPDEISIDLKIKYVSDSTFTAYGVAGIEGFSFEGTVRIMLRPLMDMVPLIGGLSISFFNMPVIDFNLTGAVGKTDALTFNQLKRTTLSKIYEEMRDMAVIPNRVCLPLTKGLDMKQLLFLEPQGVLRVKILGASVSYSGDLILKGDPYAIVTVGVQSYQTKVVNCSTSPIWNEEFEFIVDEKYGQTVTLQVMDSDSLSSDDDLGRTTSLDISDVAGQFSVDKTLRLMLADQDNGHIEIQTTFYRLSSDPKDIGSATVVPGNPPALLVVFVGSAELPEAAQNGPYLVRLSVGDKSQDSKTIEGAAALAFNQTFRFLINPKEASLKMQILKKDSQKMVGETSLALMYLPKADNMHMDSQIPLVGGVGSVRVAVMLRALTSV